MADEKGLMYMGMGVSGGEEGARNGARPLPQILFFQILNTAQVLDAHAAGRCMHACMRARMRQRPTMVYAGSG